MPPPPSITLDPSPHPALSYAQLRAEALELLGRLCGDQWSDFNTHDPGITILEQLCFALTELAYRSQWPIEDLIASAGPDWQPEAGEILQGDPVTRDDLIALVRSLGCEAVVVDVLEQASLPLLFRPSSLNASDGGTISDAAGAGGATAGAALPSPPTPPGQPTPVGDLQLCTELEAGLEGDAGQAVAPRGLWRVSVQLGSGAAGAAPASLLPIARALHGARLLGRDFVLAVLDPFKVIVRSDLEVELGPTGSASALLARVAAVLDATIRQAALRGDDRGLRSAELIQALQALPEVREVCFLRLARDPADHGHPLHLALSSQSARLDPASPIRLLEHGRPLAAPASLPTIRAGIGSPTQSDPAAQSDPTASQPAFSQAAPRVSAAGLATKTPPPTTSAGRPRQLTNVRSIARQLPAVYGVGLAGLPAEASPERRAQALQLRAYLLFFDQLLANAQAQLAFAPRLLAPVDPSDPEPLACEALLLAEDPELPAAGLRQGHPSDWQNGLRQALRRSAAASGDSHGDPSHRRAALLAHLLQRFGEELTPPSQLPASASQEARAAELARARSAYLRRVAPLSGGRGTGPDLLAPAAPAASPASGSASPGSALAASDAAQGPCAERLRRKLGLPLGPAGAPSLLLIEHLLLRPLEEDKGQLTQGGEEPIPFLADVARPDPWTGRLSVVINAALLPGGLAEAREDWLARILREELPAHLALELHLLADGASGTGSAGSGAASAIDEPGPWSAMAEAWRRFRLHLRAHRLAQLSGPDPGGDDPLLALRLRDSRDRLLALLRIGRPWPLRSIPLPELLMVASGKTTSITLPFSQRGVRYQLIEVNSGSPRGAAAVGNDGPLTLTTPPINADLSLRVQASVLAAGEPGSAELAAAAISGAGSAEGIALSASASRVSTLLAGEVRVVEGVDGSLGLRLLDASLTPLPLLHPEETALRADHGQRLVVEVLASQEGVVYEVIDDSERELPFANQRPLSEKVIGTSGNITLTLKVQAEEDRDLRVRASLDRQRGRFHKDDQRLLEAVLPLRVRANPAVPLALISRVVEEGANATVVIGTALASGTELASGTAVAGSGSQVSVTYQLVARGLQDEDWRFDDPASALELTRLDETQGGALDGFFPQAASSQGNGASLTLEQTVRGEGLLVAVLARKRHRLRAFRADDKRTAPSELPLRQAAVLYTQPDARRPVLLRAELEAPGVWSFWGGQPGVAYSLLAGAGEAASPLGAAVPIPETDDAPDGRRGIGRLRVGRDLLVAANDGPPRQAFAPDPSQQPGLSLRARFLRSGVEVAMRKPPILARVEPPALGRGEAARVLVSGLDPGQSGQLRLGDRQLSQGLAAADGALELATGPLPGASNLELDVGVRCPLSIAQGVNPDLVVRLRNGQTLLEDAPARLYAWGDRAEVELSASQGDVIYALIDAADRDKPLEQQRLFSAPQPGNGAALLLLSTPLQEDVDLLVRGTRRLAPQGPRQAIGVLDTVVALRVRANPGVPLELAQAVLEPTSPCLLWVGDGALPSQSSASYKAWSKPIGPEDWQWPDTPDTPDATDATDTPDATARPRLPTPPDAASPQQDWSGRGQPKKGTDGDSKRGQQGRLQLSLGQAGGDAWVAVIASKQHSPYPLGDPSAPSSSAPSSSAPSSVASQVVLDDQVVQPTTPNPQQRLALVAIDAGWRLVGGEPGCFYTFLRPDTRLALAGPAYVHQRTSEDPPSDWGIERLRLGVDLVVAGEDGPGMDGGPSAADLLAASAQARRAFSGTTIALALAPLVVTLEPPVVGSEDSATVVVRGLASGERARLRQSGLDPQEPASADAAVRLGTGAVPLGGAVTLEISREGSGTLLAVPLRVVLPG